MKKHILYSYRRCPYAMRARMALVVAGIQCEVHEIDFKDKPQGMLDVSPKGTVPVLITNEAKVIDESIDIMHWALSHNDPYGWLTINDFYLISENDGAFKSALDRYKYPNRFADEDCSGARGIGLEFLKKLNNLIEDNGQVMGKDISIVDIAIFPFVRQFSNVDKVWFEEQNLLTLKKWLSDHLESFLFSKIIQKQESAKYRLI